MKRDSRLSVALHALLHMEELGSVLTSEQIGTMMGTHAAAVRRTMGGLRDVGILRSEKGHGGGWTLAKPLAEITLGDVYEALGTKMLFGIGVREEAPGCVVEQHVNRALADALGEAESLLLSSLRAVRLSDIAHEVRVAKARGQKGSYAHA